MSRPPLLGLFVPVIASNAVALALVLSILVHIFRLNRPRPPAA